jgi:hypothetical protein
MEVYGHLHTPFALPAPSYPGAYQIGGCVNPRASLEVMAKRKISVPAGNEEVTTVLG